MILIKLIKLYNNIIFFIYIFINKIIRYISIIIIQLINNVRNYIENNR